jgi:hypothetical protein
MSIYQTLQEVTEGLRRCVGWGASRERLGVNRHAFQSLPGLPSLDGLHAAAAGALIRDHLVKEGINRLVGTYQLFGRTYPAATIGAALQLELALSHPGWTSRHRRQEVMTLLRITYSVDWWAREDGPEWELLYLFAEQLCVQRPDRHLRDEQGDSSDALGKTGG